MATMQDSIDMRDVMAGRMSQERLTERREARALGASFTPVPTATAELLTIRTTLHGAERIAGAAATRGGVLSRTAIVLARMFGKRMTQRDDATVFVRAQLWGGRYDVYVENRAGRMITGVGGISEKKLARLAKRYGYH